MVEAADHREPLLGGASSAGGQRGPGCRRDACVVLSLSVIIWLLGLVESSLVGFHSEAPSRKWLRDVGAPEDFYECAAKNMQCCLTGSNFTFDWSNLTQVHEDEPFATLSGMAIQWVVMNVNYMLLIFTNYSICWFLALVYILVFHFLMPERPNSEPEGVSTQRKTIKVAGRDEIEAPQVEGRGELQAAPGAEAVGDCRRCLCSEAGDEDQQLLRDLVRKFAMGIVILNIYYNNFWPFRVHKFSWSCLFIFGERIVLVWISRTVRLSVLRQRIVPKDGQSTDVSVKTLYDDVYDMRTAEGSTEPEGVLNPCKKLPRVLMIFVCQFGMGMYYYCEMNGIADGITPTNNGYDGNVGVKIRNCGEVSMVKWFIATIILHVAGEDEVGAEFQWDFWNFQFFKRPERMGTVWQMKPYKRCVLMMRFVFSFIVNSLFRCIIVGTAPMMLCVEEPLDFVKDVLAICFIIKLDDYAAENEYDVSTEMDRPAIASDAFFKALWGAVVFVWDMICDSVCCRCIIKVFASVCCRCAVCFRR